MSTAARIKELEAELAALRNVATLDVLTAALRKGLESPDGCNFYCEGNGFQVKSYIDFDTDLYQAPESFESEFGLVQILHRGGTKDLRIVLDVTRKLEDPMIQRLVNEGVKREHHALILHKNEKIVALAELKNIDQNIKDPGSGIPEDAVFPALDLLTQNQNSSKLFSQQTNRRKYGLRHQSALFFF